MTDDVGGQLETVAPRRSLFGPDYARLAILLAVGAAVHYWLVAHTAIPARDALAYTRIALNLSHPNAAVVDGPPRQRIEVVRDSIHPPGYPVAIWMTEKLLRGFTDKSLAERGLLAAQVANAIAGVLLVVPLYLIGRILFGRDVGFAGALLFQVLPVPAGMTSDGLSEGLYLLATAVAVLLAVRAARRPGVGGFLLCGLATGASYLVRPEGLLVVFATGAVIVASALTRRWPRDLALGRLAALGVGVALVAVPYMLLIGKLSNKTTSEYLMDPLNKNRGRLGLWDVREEGRAAAARGPLFAAWWNPEKDAGTNKQLWAVGAVWSEVAKSVHYVVGALALFGLFARRRQLFAPDPGLWVLVALGSLNLLLLVYLAACAGYVSERHTVLFVMVTCVLAAAAIEPLAHAITAAPVLDRLVLWPKGMPATILLVLVTSALPYTLKPLHAHREGHKHAGLWLAENMKPDDHLIDPLSWAEWYAGKTLYRSAEYKGKPEHVWVVVERGKGSPHSRLPQWEHAVGVTLDQRRKPAYRWPETAPPEGPAVEVYRLKHEEAFPPAAK
ncbi:MAG TPA: glycosyltransferase family 39 protein [Gemmata sp.]|nr:glycosyltransferase family 39 protein [Gemmata sp.]